MVGELSVRGKVRVGNCPSGNCPFGEMSGRGIVRSGKCPFGEMSVGELSIGEMSVGELSFGEMSVGEMSGYHTNVSGDDNYLVKKEREPFPSFSSYFVPSCFNSCSRLLTRL